MQVRASDVVRLVLQFLKESSLYRAMHSLQEESQITLNAVDSTDVFVADVEHARWDSVLLVVNTLQLPATLLANLYELIVLEMVELRELDTARRLMQSAPLIDLEAHDLPRYQTLVALVGRPHLDPRGVYSGSTRESQRRRVAECLRAELTMIPSSRLLSLLGQSLKWQQYVGELPTGTQFDIFAGCVTARVGEAENFVSKPGPV